MGFFDRLFGKKTPATPEDMIIANIQAIGLESFPDDEGAVWNVDTIYLDNGVYLVETSPVPHVGYERIRFHLSQPNVSGVMAADYWGNGQWNGLFSSERRGLRGRFLSETFPLYVGCGFN